MRPKDPDKRAELIDRLNTRRVEKGASVLTPRQEHLVREFADDDGVVPDRDLDSLRYLLESNSL
jgi:hypothetical protein